MNDTVEKNVEGVAEAIVAQDEETRAQELVSLQFLPVTGVNVAEHNPGLGQHSPQTCKLGFKARDE